MSYPPPPPGGYPMYGAPPMPGVGSQYPAPGPAPGPALGFDNITSQPPGGVPGVSTGHAVVLWIMNWLKYS